LGNVVSIEDVLAAYGADAFRLAVVNAHYRRSADLGAREMEDAKARLERLQNLVRRAEAAGVDHRPAPLGGATRARFREAVGDGFNTPKARAGVFDAAAAATRAVDCDDLDAAASLVATVLELTGALGMTVEVSRDDDTEIDELVARRDDARAARDFAA